MRYIGWILHLFGNHKAHWPYVDGPRWTRMKHRFGTRKHYCADCGHTQMEHPQTLARRCKPHCKKCGSTFLNPWSEGADEAFVNAGTARKALDRVRDGTGVPTGKEHQQLQD